MPNKIHNIQHGIKIYILKKKKEEDGWMADVVSRVPDKNTSLAQEHELNVKWIMVLTGGSSLMS